MGVLIAIETCMGVVRPVRLQDEKESGWLLQMPKQGLGCALKMGNRANGRGHLILLVQRFDAGY